MQADIIVPTITALIGAVFAYVVSRGQNQLELRRLDLERARLEAENARLRTESEQMQQEYHREDRAHRQKVAHELLLSLDGLLFLFQFPLLMSTVEEMHKTKERFRQMKRTIDIFGSPRMKNCVAEMSRIVDKVHPDFVLPWRVEKQRHRISKLQSDLEEAIHEYAK